MRVYELPIQLQREKTGYLAYCPVWQDCYAQGDTIEEVLQEVYAVANTLIEIYKEEELTIPLKQKSTERSVRKRVALRLPVYTS